MAGDPRGILSSSVAVSVYWLTCWARGLIVRDECICPQFEKTVHVLFLIVRELRELLRLSARVLRHH